MKQHLKHLATLTLTALLGILTLQADVIINETNFPDENFRNLILNDTHNQASDSIGWRCNLNGRGKDGVLTDDEIAKITHISCSFENIASLKGIEYFTELTLLNCAQNKLEALDLSRNTKLKILVCNNNNLTKIILNNLTGIETLRCHKNQLTSLDVSKNTRLTKLDCSFNQLAQINVKNNTALKELWCNNNKLTSLDVSKNTALTILWCRANKLTSINVSKNTLLEELDCGSNELEALDLSRNTRLTRLGCNNQQSSNKLKTLDLSKNTELKELRCDKNNLSELAIPQTLTFLHCENNSLVEIDLSKNPNIWNGWVYWPECSGVKDGILLTLKNQSRQINAEVGWTADNEGTKKKFYYLSLDALAGQGNGMQTLAQKLGVDDHADEWWSRVNKETMSGATLLTGSRKAATASDIDPKTVYGSILVLTPTKETETSASGSMTYAYNMRYTGTDTQVQQKANNNNFTLNWTADAQVITNVLRLGDGIEVPVNTVQFVNLAGQMSDMPWQGVNIVVTRYSDGSTKTDKTVY